MAGRFRAETADFILRACMLLHDHTGPDAALICRLDDLVVATGVVLHQRIGHIQDRRLAPVGLAHEGHFKSGIAVCQKLHDRRIRSPECVDRLIVITHKGNGRPRELPHPIPIDLVHAIAGIGHLVVVGSLG